MKKLKSLIAILIVMILALSAIMPTVSFADGGTCTLTVTSSEASLAGRTLNLYKLFDLEVIGSGDDTEYVYSWDGLASKDFFAQYTATSIMSLYEVVEYITSLGEDSTALVVLADAYYTYISSYTGSGTVLIATQTSSDGSDITFSGLATGYYLVYDVTSDLQDPEVVATAMLKTVSENAEIVLKADVPTVDKTVNESNDDSTTASVGDVLTFTITSNVPNTVGYDTYVYTMTDTLSTGLSWVSEASQVVVKIGETQLTQNTDYTVTISGQTLTINFGTKADGSEVYNAKSLFETYTMGDAITVTYQVKVNSSAVTYNNNTVELSYSNDPDKSSSTGTDTDIVPVYSFDVKVVKENSANETLSGAKFVLKNSDGKYYSGTSGWVENQSDATEYTSANDGSLDLPSLAEGTYYLVETEAPEGYALPDSLTIGFTITVNESGESQTASIAVTSDSTANYVVTGATTTITLQGESTTGTLDLVVYNYSDSELLPSTGGIGTTIFTIVGIAVMAIAVIALVVRNRRSKRA